MMTEKRRVVLIVEDEAILRMLTVDGFQELGFHVLEASSGAEALGLIRDRDELWGVCTDVEMPGPVNGLVLAHRLRMKFPSVRIVICSGRKLPSKQELPTQARFVAKPYSLDDLRFALDEVEE
jgi:CheY-like chemotaxis protein